MDQSRVLDITQTTAPIPSHLLDGLPGGELLPSPNGSRHFPSTSQAANVTLRVLDNPSFTSPPQPALPGPSQRSIVHAPFDYVRNEIIWVEEVDAGRVRAFLATPPPAEVNNSSSSRPATSGTPSLRGSSPRSLWRVLDLKTFLGTVLRKLLAVSSWKQLFLRLLLRCLREPHKPRSSLVHVDLG